MAKAVSPTFLHDHGYLVSQVQLRKLGPLRRRRSPSSTIFFSCVLHFVFLFTPVGMLCGILLAWVVNYIALLRSSFSIMIRRAVGKNSMSVSSQSLKPTRAVGAEALVRWKSDHGNIQPDHFWPKIAASSICITGQVLAIITEDLPRILA